MGTPGTDGAIGPGAPLAREGGCDMSPRSTVFATAALVFGLWRLPTGAHADALPGGSLDPTSITKYVTPLLIPPAMPRASATGGLDRYEIAVRQFAQQVLPPGLPATTVWGYGSVTDPGSFNYPSFTIEAREIGRAS